MNEAASINNGSPRVPASPSRCAASNAFKLTICLQHGMVDAGGEASLVVGVATLTVRAAERGISAALFIAPLTEKAHHAACFAGSFPLSKPGNFGPESSPLRFADHLYIIPGPKRSR